MCKHKCQPSTHTCRVFYNDNITTYCVHCIWEKHTNKQVVKIPLGDLPNIDEITWNEELYDPKTKVRHIRRIWNADMSHPIFITADNQIIDGCHRIHCAHNRGDTTISAIILSPEDLAECTFD